MSKTLKFTDGDMVRSYTNSSYLYVEDGEKIKQDVALMLTSGVRASTGLGCDLDGVIGKDAENPLYAYSQFPIVFNFQTRIRIGLERFRNQQRKYLFSQRTPKELIFDFAPAEVWIDSSDPRLFKFRVDVLTEDGRTSFSLSGAARA